MPDWARYQRGRSFDLSLFNDEARRCLMTAFGYVENPATPLTALPSLHQDLRGTLAMIDYFRRNFDANNPRAGGNRANPADSNDRGDANIITAYEIEQFVWETVRSSPENVRWDQMRDQGDGTLRRLHALLGIAQFLGTETPPPPRPTPPAVAEADTGWSRRDWGELAGFLVVTGAVVALGLLTRRTRIRSAEMREEIRRVEVELPAVRERTRLLEGEVRALEAQSAAARQVLEPFAKDPAVGRVLNFLNVRPQ